MGGFFGALFGGQSKNLDKLIGQYGQIGGQQTGEGQSNENTASNFWNSIVSGDSSKISQALAPEISAAKTSNQQTQKTNAIFGTRSGGTAASNAASSDALHANLVNLTGSLTNSSASNLASLGTNQVSTGLGALGQQQNAVAQQMANWSNSILGKGISSAASFAESYGLSKLPGANNSNQQGSQGVFGSTTSSSYQPVYDNDGNQIA
jgi:hypothetical protein